MIKISTVIITFNEEKNIEDCIKSVLWSDEIIVVDSMSTDRTLALAGRFRKVRTYTRKFTGYSDQKNWAIVKARNDWVLSLDADERVPEGLKEEIARIAGSSKVSGYRIPRRNFYFDCWLVHGGLFPDWQLRLFRKESGRYRSVLLHEGVSVNGPVVQLTEPMLHFSYRSVNEYFERFKKYTDLEKEIMIHQKEKVNLWSFLYYALTLPLKKFFTRYIFKLGFLDGFTGLMVLKLNNLTKLVAFYKYYLERKKNKEK